MSFNIHDVPVTRQTKCFVAAESAYGVLAAFNAADAVRPLGVPAISQAESFSENRELRDSLSAAGRFRDQTPPGQWSITVYARPSGAAGTPPAEAVLMKAAMGSEAISAGASVTYGLAKTLPSLSVACKVDHITSFAVGCMVAQARVSVSPKGGLEIAFSGPCQKVMYAGRGATASGSTTTVLQLASGGAKLFDVGARVQVGDDDNTGAGYVISAVDLTGDTITLSAACSEAPAGGVTVEGFVPTPTYSGAPLENRSGSLRFGGSEVEITQGELVIANDIKTYDDLLSSDGYAPGARSKGRGVSGSFSCYFLREHAAHYKLAKNATRQQVQMAFDAGAGSILTLTVPYAELDTPDVSGEEDLVETVRFTGFASATGEDEMSVVYS